MPPRRHRSVSNVNAAQDATPPPERIFTPAGNSQQQMGMLPAVYQSNMNVLQRREPAITAIIDQFSHVCLYRHNGQKWEKYGFEGSMFLFEKSTQPIYGFYILNRMGTDDYVRPIYPEDDMGKNGGYLMCRFYPDFTKTRIKMGLPYPIPEEDRGAFQIELSKCIPPEDQEKDKDKEKRGSSVTLGLWMYATDAREPLQDVMMRIHSYIKRGLPYPDEYRYGPGRPPPPNPHVRSAGATPMQVPPERAGNAQQPNNDSVTQSQVGPPAVQTPGLATSTTSSDLDKLFSKLLPSSSSVPAQSSGKLVNNLFAPLVGAGSVQQSQVVSSPQPPVPLSVPSQNRTPNRGIALLDTIFASAKSSDFALTRTTQVQAAQQASPSDLPVRPEEIVIVSPKPTHKALPQVLNQDVISTLLGLGPDSGSRASSAAPSSVGSHRSAQRYEGDNEYSEGDFTSEGEVATTRNTRVAGSSSRGVPTLSVPMTPSSESDIGKGKVNGSRRISGDVTPRPAGGGARLPPTSPPHFQQRIATPNVTVIRDANGAAAPSPVPSSASTSQGRPLVPFEANSDLWPYPRAPLDDRSYDQDDVVELDFTDTRALSDPTIFSSRLKEKKDKRDKGKKGKREREREKEREKAEIEKGWDLPTQTQGQPAYHHAATGPVAAAAATPTQPTVINSAKQAKKSGVNGTNGHSENGALDGTSVKDVILGAMLNQGQGSGISAVSRNDFIQELLTLIHTDHEFVDNLWQDYLSRAT